MRNGERPPHWGAVPREGLTEEPFLFHATSEIVNDGHARAEAAVWSWEGTLAVPTQQLYTFLDSRTSASGLRRGVPHTQCGLRM